MSRDELVSSLAVHWSNMAEFMQVAEQYFNLKREAEDGYELIFATIASGEYEASEIRSAMLEACDVAGLTHEHPVVLAIESELVRIEVEKRAAQAAMN